MPVRETALARGNRLVRAERARIGGELRMARVGAGLSLAAVGQEIGLSGSQVSRIERSAAPAVTVRQLVLIGAIVGIDVRVHAYPGGDPIRDIGQVRVIDRLARRLPPAVVVRREVTLGIGGDLRAWDASIDGLEPTPTEGDRKARRSLKVEAETRIADIQALLRRLARKMRDGEEDTVLLLVADTRHNRAALEAGSPSLATLFPIPARAAWAALVAGQHPGGSAILLV